MYKPNSNVCAPACTTTSCSFCECKQSTDLTHTQTQKRAYTDKRVHQTTSTLTSFTLRLLLLLPSTLLLAVHTYWVSVSSSQPVHQFQRHRKFRKVQQQPPQPLKQQQQQRQRKRQRFVEPVAASACACALCLVPGQLLPKPKPNTLEAHHEVSVLFPHLISSFHPHSGNRDNCSDYTPYSLATVTIFVTHIRVGDDHKVLICFVHKLNPTGVSVCKNPVSCTRLSNYSKITHKAING